MPPRKKSKDTTGASLSIPAFDGTRFISVDAVDAHAKGLRTKSLVAERAFNYKNFSLESIFEVRNWDDGLFVPPAQAVVPIFREFYANAKAIGESGRSWV